MNLETLISHTGILMTFDLSIILDLQNFFHWYILQSWKLKRPQIQLRPHHVWTYTSNLTTVVNSVLKFMINGTTSEFCLKNLWNCSLTQQILSHRFCDWKLCELFLLSGFLICHAVRVGRCYQFEQILLCTSLFTSAIQDHFYICSA
jgi:hypothetical protein